MCAVLCITETLDLATTLRYFVCEVRSATVKVFHMVHTDCASIPLHRTMVQSCGWKIMSS